MDRRHRHQPGAGATVEIVEERQVLEEVRVQPASDQQVVGLVEALEDLDLQVDLADGQRLAYEIEDLRMRHRGSADAQRSLALGADGAHRAAHGPKTTDARVCRKPAGSANVSNCYNV